MSWRNFQEELKKGLPSPAYLLYTSDPFLASEAVSGIRSLAPSEQADFLFSRFDIINDPGATADAIVDVLNTVPFFQGRKFVLAENIQKFLKKDVKKIESYLARPAESSVFVMINFGAPKKDAGEWASGAHRISLDMPEKEISSWLKSRAKNLGIELTDDAVEYLLGTIGPDLGLLASETDKCSLLGKTRISREDMAEIIEGRRTYGAFGLVDAIGRGDVQEAFRLYRSLRETEESYSLLGALNWQYSKSTAGKSPEAAEKIFRALHEADTGIKTSGDSWPFELAILGLLRLSSGGNRDKKGWKRSQN